MGYGDYMSKYIGYDGKEYDSLLELNGANERWEREKEQKESLERQEELIEQQNELIEEQIEDRRRLVEEQMENDEWIEIERQEHDKEMRLLSLCDKIGISQKLTDGFIKYIIGNDINAETNEKIKSIYSQIEETSKKIADIKKQNAHKLSILNQVSNFNFENVSKLDDSDFNSAKAMSDKYFFKILLFLVLGVLIFVFAPIITTVYVILGIVCFFVSIGFLALMSRMIALKSEADKNIAELANAKSNEIVNDEAANEFAELKELNDRKDLIVEEIKQEYAKEVKDRLNEFYQFRLNHYNSEVEKFLIDYDFEEILKNKFNINYEILTKSKSLEQGDIEDYIEYFHNVSNKNQ